MIEHSRYDIVDGILYYENPNMEVADSGTYLLARDTDQKKHTMVDLEDTSLNTRSMNNCESTTGGIR